MQVTTPRRVLPELIPLGRMTICIPTDNEKVGDEYFKKITERIRREFFKKRRKIFFFYSLEFELLHIYEGSRNYQTKPFLKLRKGWALAGSLSLMIIAYPSLKDGATEIVNDLRSASEHVIKHEREENSETAPTLKDCIPPDKNEEA